MAHKTLKQITKYKTRLASLERDLFAQLAKLPAQYGFASAEEFLAAFEKAKNTKPALKKAKAPKAATVEKKAKTAKVAKAPKAGRKARVKVTPEIIAQVKALTEAGKSGKEIAEAAGISLPTVQNLKKKLGLIVAPVAGEAAAVVVETVAPVASEPVAIDPSAVV